MPTISVECLCKNVDDSVELSATSVPVNTALCHCSLCRKTSGVLFSSYLSVTGPPRFLSKLIEYRNGSEASRYFCGICGAHAAARSACGYSLAFSVAAGLVQDRGEISRVIQHLNNNSTLDGGLSVFLTGIGDRPITKEVHQGDFTTSEQESSSSHIDATEKGEILPASCYCGGVTFYITRPNVQSTRPRSPWPDLLVPYHSGSPENKQDIKWWLRANQTKYLAGTCACRSCRLGAGFPIQCWAFIPKPNIRISDGRTLDFKIGLLRQYESSPGVFRDFCTRCGATAFWHCNERPELIDVSVGLLNDPSGARAENWLDWETRRVSFVEEARDRELAEALERGMQVWTKEQD